MILILNYAFLESWWFYLKNWISHADLQAGRKQRRGLWFSASKRKIPSYKYQSFPSWFSGLQTRLVSMRTQV